jgi:hypothetical protein
VVRVPRSVGGANDSERPSVSSGRRLPILLWRRGCTVRGGCDTARRGRWPHFSDAAKENVDARA